MIKNAIKHLNKIRKHRKWVRKYCFYNKLYWQGLTHDLSKYSPTEFIESTYYYVGTSSPIDEAKADKGYSSAWFHHRGRNRHHYEYWMDNFDKGGEAIMMPYKYFAEMVCDYLGAGRAYNDTFTYNQEYEWWKNKREKIACHPKIRNMLEIVFWDLKETERFIQENPAYKDYSDNSLSILTNWEIRFLFGEGYLKKVYEANK